MPSRSGSSTEPSATATTGHSVTMETSVTGPYPPLGCGRSKKNQSSLKRPSISVQTVC
ncbi:hypothetical protein DPMN_052754 [Dreissena polymorpha]|uniref:Uncharacterized protein n=1 Tax=Dreissena polymorpha TaxID=45954 RepID=A0A9D4CM30_DREPO|nr:hypothetical protein DPMN_052754 [Dreissena polymorpha]